MDQRKSHLVVSGRWDDTVAIVDVAAALQRENDGTDRAVISRPRVTPDIDTDGDGIPDAVASGQPIAVAVDAKRRLAYIVNHSGTATRAAAAAFQHGHPGLVAVVDLLRAIDPAHDRTLGAVTAFVPTGRTGPVGPALTVDGTTLLVACGEAECSEDGGDEVTAIDTTTLSIAARIRLAGRPEHPARAPSRHASPHPTFGRWPNPTAIAVSPVAGGVLLVANGGFSDVSVHDLAAAMGGGADHELGRVNVETGPFGIAVSSDGRLAAVAAREDMSKPYEGRTVSLIDVASAAAGCTDAEIARIPVGSDDPAEPTRPFAVAFAPDGRHLVASCFRTNTISLVDVDAALAGRTAEVARIRPQLAGGAPARPRGIAIVGPDLAAVTGGAKSGPGSSVVFLIDLRRARVAATVTGVGNESYFLAAFEA